MALYTFPLALDQFFDLLPIGSVRFEPTEAVEISETADGQLLAADIGVALWQGHFILSDVQHEEALDIAPLINLLRRAGTSFLVTDPRRPRPRLIAPEIRLTPPPAGLFISADPDPGDISGMVALFSGATPVIGTIDPSMRALSISGLPPNVKLARGDLISFTYGASPLRYALHELVAPVTANGAGETELVEVSPPIRPGAAPGTALRLEEPVCKAILIPKTADTGVSVETVTGEMQIRWMQTLG